MSAERHAVAPDDEGRHPPEAAQLWNESWYADFVAADGAAAGYVRWGLYPNWGVSWWTVAVLRPGRPLLTSVSYDMGVPDRGVARTEGDWSVALGSPEPLRRFTVRSDGPATAHARPEDVYTGAAGAPARLGVDLEWTTDGLPYHYVLTTRYEVPCTVAGRLVVDGEEISVTGQGQRDHSWGVRDWWSLGWCWSAARLDDGTRVHAVDIRAPGLFAPVVFGYLQQPATGSVQPLERLAVTEELGDHGLPRRARLVLEPGALALTVEPVGFGPLLLTGPEGQRSRFPRAHARFTADDGRAGEGWIEWNQPQAHPG